MLLGRNGQVVGREAERVNETNDLPVGVFGAEGRMGRLVCDALEAAPGLSVVARIGRTTDREAAAAARVVVDFTTADAAMENAAWALDRGMDVVIGTTGLTRSHHADLEARLRRTPGASVLVVPNFSISAMLASSFAATAAKYFEYAEILDLTHPGKVDAPSGTAAEAAQAMDEARRQAGRTGPSPDATSPEGVAARGMRVGDVPIHSIRMRGLVSHLEVLLTNAGEQLTIRCDTRDRSAFMPEVVRAVGFAREHSGLFVGLASLHEQGDRP